MSYVYREDLDKLVAQGCSSPGCTHTAHDEPMYLHGGCHPGGRLVVAYRDGKIGIGCEECGKQIAMIQVARKAARRVTP